jgi:hypothetical protein
LTGKIASNDGKRITNVKNAAHWVIAKGKVERLKGRLESVCESLRASLDDFKM